MRFLILGGGGFLGKNLAHLLLDKGHKIRILERAGYDAMRFPMHGEIEWYFGDFAETKKLEPLLADVDVVFHLISTTLPKSSNDDPRLDIETNLVGTVSFLQLACTAGVRKVVFSSSGGTVYGIPESIPIGENHPTNPICSYGITKLAIEKYLHLFHRLHGLDYTVLRISNPFGPQQCGISSQGAIAVFLHKALTDAEIEIWGDGTVTRDYIYVEDVARAFYNAAMPNPGPRLYNIGSGTGHSINEVLTHIQSLLDQPLRIRYRAGRPFDVPTNVLDIARAKRHLDWEPRLSLAEGLEATMAWMKRENG